MKCSIRSLLSMKKKKKNCFFYNFYRKLLILISQKSEEYKEIMKISVQFHLNSIAR